MILIYTTLTEMLSNNVQAKVLKRLPLLSAIDFIFVVVVFWIGKRFLDPQRGETGGWILVPTLAHHLRNN